MIRKIAESINIRINVGNFQHIDITKYAEEEIDFTTTEERTSKEDALRDDIVQSIIRSMKSIPEMLGKGVPNANEVQTLIVKAMPEWLKNNPVPNIANKALDTHNKTSAEIKGKVESAVELMSNVLSETSETKVESVKQATQAAQTAKAQTTISDEEDLFK